MKGRDLNYNHAIIKDEYGEYFYSHQRLVVITLMRNGIDANFNEEQLENAISEIDMIKDLNIKMEDDITIEDIFFQLSNI
jgi:deoxyadenosine/deoxycytidine kinase